MWSKAVAFLKVFIPMVIKKYATAFLLNLLRLSGGVWSWVISFALMFVWDKVEKEIESEARVQDQKDIDDANLTKLNADKAAGAAVETIIKDETNLLNGDSK